MAKQFALHQVFRERAAINRNERARVPGTQVMNVARDQFFAGAGFANDKNIGDTGRDQLDPIE